MKVGILTFHNAINYGAVLQTYATQEIVKRYGHDVEVIDYHNEKIDAVYKIGIKHFITKRLLYLPFLWIKNYFFIRRKLAFARFFMKHLTLSKKKYNKNRNISIEGYDIILFGSDQIWNKKLTGGFDDVYWGNVGNSSQTKKIAWSVCMNEEYDGDEDRSYILKNLKNFDAICVREKSLQIFLNRLAGKMYPQTLDPTLLLSKDQWDKLCHPVKESNYIAVYAVQNEIETIEYARCLANQIHKKIRVIRSYSKHQLSNEYKEHAGPSEFLSYIKYADFVVTTSFHGTVFSLIFQKEFVCPIFRENNRIDSLLELAGIMERRINTNADISNLPVLNYDIISSKLLKARSETQAFLKNVLQ